MLRPSLRMNLAQKGGQGAGSPSALKIYHKLVRCIGDRYIMVNMRNGPRVAPLRPFPKLPSN